MKILAGLLGGLVFAIIGAFWVTAALASSPLKGGHVGAMAFWVLWGLALLIAMLAPSGGKAWRRILIASGLLCLLLPLSGIIFTGNSMAAVSSADPHAGARVAGSAIAGGLISGLLGFVGFFLGLVFLVIGLLVGRDKTVVYVQAPAAVPSDPSNKGAG